MELRPDATTEAGGYTLAEVGLLIGAAVHGGAGDALKELGVHPIQPANPLRGHHLITLQQVRDLGRPQEGVL